MKDDNLKNAINDLPQFEAPDVWNNIEKSLKPKRRKFIFPLILIMIICSGIAYVVIENMQSKEHDIITAQNSDLDQIIESNTESLFIIYEENPVEYTEAGDSQITKISHQENLSPQIIIDKDIDDEDVISQEDINIVDDLTDVSGKVDIDIITEERIIYIEKGENLVKNPSFEDFRICPSGIVGKPSRRLIPDWQVPNKGTPDYFNVCSRKDAGVPDNFAGRIDAHSGNGYAGMILRQNFTRDNKITGEKALIYREYLQNELKEELVEGKTYKIVFWVCNSTNSRFAVDGVGACVTIDKEWTNHKEVMELIPVVENPVGNILMNRNYWVAIEGYYTAQGGEKFITLGNFRNNFSTNYLMQDNESAFNYSYYYIDDVSVIEVKEEVETHIIDCSDQTPMGSENMSLNELPDGDW